MITVGIVGGAGYTAGELIRLLKHHQNVTIDFVYSTSNAGNPLSSVHQDMVGQSDLMFSDGINPEVDLVFLCLGHGHSTTFLSENSFSTNTRIIDLSTDYRWNTKGKDTEGFVYGLPELQRDKIQCAQKVANPGCFATAIQLALLPLAKAGRLDHDVHIHALTGSTGAGTGLSPTSHFSWRNNNVSYYKPFSHQHEAEVMASFTAVGAEAAKLRFLPIRGNFARGIFLTAYLKFEGSEDEAYAIYDDFYRDARFTHRSADPIHLKQVVNTNNCLIHLHRHDDVLLITSAIDNLLKGASGQAVENMNLLFGFEPDAGLQLKANYF